MTWTFILQKDNTQTNISGKPFHDEFIYLLKLKPYSFHNKVIHHCKCISKEISDIFSIVTAK